MKASDFSLSDEHGIMHSLSDYKGKWLVIYFYPKDDTPGCTKEACSFRDSTSLLSQMDVNVIGISKDSVDSHKKFHDKYKLNFTLLSDESLSVIKKYDAWGKKKFLGKEYEGVLRVTYIVDGSGEIRKKYESVNPLNHTPEIIKDLQVLTS